MKWLVYYSHVYFSGKGDPYHSPSIIGYSDKNEKELFDILEKEYPNYSVLKLIKHKLKYGYDCDYYNVVGGKVDSPYDKDYVYFTPNKLKEF